MPVLVRANGQPRAARAVAPTDNWSDAVTKLIPIEVVAAYLAAVQIVTGLESSTSVAVAQWILFGIGALATILYMLATWDPDPAVRESDLKSAWPQLFISLAAFVTWAFDKGFAYQVIGGGSNLLITDKGIRGVVVKLSKEMNQIREKERTEDFVRISALAGARLQTLCRYAIRKGFKGLNFALGIPGTVGGAITMRRAAANMVREAGLSEQDARRLTVTNPRRAIGLEAS